MFDSNGIKLNVFCKYIGEISLSMKTFEKTQLGIINKNTERR